MKSSTEAFIAHVAAHAGIAPERASQVTRAVLARIGVSLTPERRQQIADELPPALASAVLQHEEHVAEALTVHSRELVASVYHVLAEDLSHDALGWLRAELPPRMAELLVADAEPAEHSSTNGASLATGRPGSRNPISEGRRRR